MSKKVNDTLIQNFRHITRNYSDASIFMHEAIARKAGLTGSDHKYLGLILKHKRLTAGDLSKLTGLTTGAVTGLIDRLENKKLIKREFDKSDRRKVFLTPNEGNIMELILPLFNDLQQKTTSLISSFTEMEIKVIERYFVEATQIMIETTNNLNNNKQ